MEIEEAYFGGRRKGKPRRGALHKVPVFGILKRKGEVMVEVLKRCKCRIYCASGS